MTRFLEKLQKNKLIIYAALLIVPLLVYWKSVYYEFSPLDEQWLIVNRGSFLSEWESLWKAFGQSIQNIYYRPFFSWSLIIDYHFGEENPFVYHLSNVIYHLCAVLLLYRFLVLLEVSGTKAFVFSFLFSVHPLVLHAVAWVPGRNDVLLCVFTLLSLIQLVKYEQSTKIKHGFLHLLFYVFALLTKETAIVLPFVFLFLSLSYKPFTSKKYVLVFFWLGLSGLWFWIRTLVVDQLLRSSTNYLLSIKNFLFSFLVAMGKALLPFSQSVTPTVENSMPLIYLGIVILFLFLTYRVGVKNKKIAAFGVFMFIALTVLPMWHGILSSLGEQYEHRAYTPLIGLMVFASQLNIDFASWKLKLFMLLISIFFVAKSLIRIELYKHPLPFVVEAVTDSPENYIYQFQISDYLYHRKNYESALLYVNNAIAKQPRKPQMYYCRANIYVELNRVREAISDYSKAISLNKNKPEWILARCKAYLKFKDVKNAARDMQYIQKNFPGVMPPMLELEISMALEVEKNKAFSDLNSLIQMKPDSAELYVLRAKQYFDRNLGHEALADLKKACELQPKNKIFKGYYDKLNSTFPH